MVLGFIGWGNLVLNVLASRWVSGRSGGLAATVGISFAVFVGGGLNLLHLIIGWILISFILIGSGYAFMQMISASRHRNIIPEIRPLISAWSGTWLWQRVAVLCFIFVLLFRMASLPRVDDYYPTDDEQFYLATPVKMMKMHYLAEDPFSERRIQSSLGGNFFLQALVMGALPLQNIQMADKYLGLALIILISLALAKQFNLSPLEITLFGIIAMAIPSTDINLTFVFLPSALFLALVFLGTQTLYLIKRPGIYAFLLGAISGAICSLKSVYLPHAAAFCLALYLLWGLEKGWKFAFKGWFFTLIGALFILSPWMVAMRITCGTFLYPILGAGDDFTAYPYSPASTASLAAHMIREGVIFVVPLAVLGFAQRFFLRRDDNSNVLLALTLACLAGTIAIDFATAGDTVRRYNFPVLMPVLLLMYLQFYTEIHLRPLWKPGQYLRMIAAPLLLVAVMAFIPLGHEYAKMTREIRTSLKDTPLCSAEVLEEYEQIDSALPRTGLILATLQHPYLLDGLDNRILLADWPGCASPPPGWPINEDGEALAAYLLQHSIRYLAYSYTQNKQLSHCLRNTDDHGIFGLVCKNQYSRYVLANKQYLELKQSRRILYDDGKVFILDLSSQ